MGVAKPDLEENKHKNWVKTGKMPNFPGILVETFQFVTEYLNTPISPF